MPTPTKEPRLGAGPTHQRMILSNLSQQLFEHKRITTTVTKAKRKIGRASCRERV